MHPLRIDKRLLLGSLSSRPPIRRAPPALALRVEPTSTVNRSIEPVGVRPRNGFNSSFKTRSGVCGHRATRSSTIRCARRAGRAVAKCSREAALRIKKNVTGRRLVRGTVPLRRQKNSNGKRIGRLSITRCSENHCPSFRRAKISQKHLQIPPKKRIKTEGVQNPPNARKN